MASKPDGAAERRSKILVAGDQGVKTTRTVTIRKPAEVLYAFWRKRENLPVVIREPVSFTPLSDIESHWSVSAPGDRRVGWDALIINDEPARLIAWRAREDSRIANAGSIRFDAAPGDEGTEVAVNLEYAPPGGALGAWIANLSGLEAGQADQPCPAPFQGADGSGRDCHHRGTACGTTSKRSK